MMWNFFILFFYEASFEIALSIAIGLKYIWVYDSSSHPEESASNATTRSVHRVLVYTFFVIQVLSCLAVIVIMTRKIVKLEKM